MEKGRTLYWIGEVLHSSFLFTLVMLQHFCCQNVVPEKVIQHQVLCPCKYGNSHELTLLQAHR